LTLDAVSPTVVTGFQLGATVDFGTDCFYTKDFSNDVCVPESLNVFFYNPLSVKSESDFMPERASPITFQFHSLVVSLSDIVFSCRACPSFGLSINTSWKMFLSSVS